MGQSDRALFTLTVRVPYGQMRLEITSHVMFIGFTALGLGIIPWRFAPFAVIGLPVFLHRFLRPPTAGRPRWLTWVAWGAGGSYLVFLLVQNSW